MSPEAAENALRYVGMAYAFVFVLFFGFAWRISATTKRLAEKIEELERDHS